MKILTFFFVCTGALSLALSARTQQPVNESQTQADQIRQSSSQNSPTVNGKPPMRVRALFKNDAGTVTVTFLLLPGQTLKLYDPYFDFVKITSDFPVSVRGTDCSSDGPTDFDCRNIPNDRYLIIDDSRVGVSPESSPSNRVKFVAVRHAKSN